MMALTKVLITVKTYPTISSKYDELVCTAGFREDGTWIRIFPVQFRKKLYTEQYKKYDWIEIDLVKNNSDYRPESYRPYSHDSEIKIIGHLNTDNNWSKRKKYVLNNVHYNLKKLITEAKDKNIRTSLAVFKPTEILDFKIEEVDREWDPQKLEQLKQLNLFESSNTENKFEIVKKLPFKFKFIIKDNEGVKSDMMIEDWEIGQLYWNCLAQHNGNELKAVNDVRNKFFNDLAKTKDLYLFLGTTPKHHHISWNPFIIIGLFYPKFESQLRFDF